MTIQSDYDSLLSAVDSAASAAQAVADTVATLLDTEADAAALSNFARDVAAKARVQANEVIKLQADLEQSGLADQLSTAGV